MMEKEEEKKKHRGRPPQVPPTYQVRVILTFDPTTVEADRLLVAALEQAPPGRRSRIVVNWLRLYVAPHLAQLAPLDPSQVERLAGIVLGAPSPPEFTEMIPAAVRALSDRRRTVLELRYGLRDGRPRTLEEVGRELRVTRQRVRQLETLAILDLSAMLWKERRRFLRLGEEEEAVPDAASATTTLNEE